MTPEEYLHLYEKYLSGKCSEEEERLLMNYQDDFKLTDKETLNQEDLSVQNSVFEKIQNTLNLEEDSSTLNLEEGIRKIKRINLRWISIAAMLILVVGITFLLVKNLGKENVIQNTAVTTIKPGMKTASLTLADGSVIVLDDAKTGHIAAEGITAIEKLRDGELAYHVNGSSQTSSINNLSTPKGGTYSVTLPDGTKVWLNAASTLTYPTVFNGLERRVKLEGEAYFEVTQNKSQPFYVEANGTETKVLGTHFNISAYTEDEAVKTTLLEGAVQFTNTQSTINLIPGEQGISTDNKNIKVNKINVNNEICWKDGYFTFNDTDVKDVMRQISRWYNVEVEYQGDVNNVTFGGIFSMQKDFLELLKGLEQTGLVAFKVEGRRITVMK